MKYSVEEIVQDIESHFDADRAKLRSIRDAEAKEWNRVLVGVVHKMKTEITFDGNKSIVIIQTPVSAKSFTQVTCLMSDEEFEQAKLERPDLIFSKPEDMPAIGEYIPELPVGGIVEDETKGITVTGMALPHDLEARANRILGIIPKE